MGTKNINGTLNVTGAITLNGQEISDGSLIESIIWSDLKELRDAGGLTPGKFYRITDYATIVASQISQPSTLYLYSAGHQFDLIVQASSANQLRVEATAILHEGDTYFANSDLSAWQIWYCLDNDTARFNWANSAAGKGVIYRLIDEFGNDCPYDFKNIMMLFNINDARAKYTFNYNTSGSSSYNYKSNDASMKKTTTKNIVKSYTLWYNDNVLHCINGILFDVGTDTNKYNFSCNLVDEQCYKIRIGNSNNIIQRDCHMITLGQWAGYNLIGQACNNIELGSSCSNNIIGSGCGNIAFRSNCRRNIIGLGCDNITFTGDNHSNTVGSYCYNITAYGDVSANSIGNACNNIEFASNSKNITIGNGCEKIYFYRDATTSTVSDLNYIRNMIIDNGCTNLVITSDDTTASSSNYLQNIHIHLGVHGSDETKNVITVARNLDYETNIISAN